MVVVNVSSGIRSAVFCTHGAPDNGSSVSGMIKFGSRTELYLPASEEIECMVRVGDKVKAGMSPLAKYRRS